MRILLIDGQGGKLGKELAENILKRFNQVDLIGVGTNSIATSAIMKAGVTQVATGENPVLFNAERCDVIIGPIGLIAANSLLGEITPAMANAIASSKAVKILVPTNRCNNIIAGVTNTNLSFLIDDAMNKLSAVLGKETK